MTTNQLIEEHVSYAEKLAQRFHRERRLYGVELDDLIGAAMLGLCDSAQRFNQSKGMKFRTFSYLRIRGAMFDYLRKHGGVPRREFRGENAKQNSDQVRITYDPKELLRMEALFTEFGMKVHSTCNSSELDISYSNDKNPEDLIGAMKVREQLENLLRQLPDRERQIIKYRYYEEMTFEDMSEELDGVSKSWVSRLHSRAMEDLKKCVPSEFKEAIAA